MKSIPQMQNELKTVAAHAAVISAIKPHFIELSRAALSTGADMSALAADPNLDRVNSIRKSIARMTVEIDAIETVLQTSAAGGTAQ